jgi:hypothetical protein
MERYLDPGEQRWARFYRDGSGLRVVRGHVYIGGCERTHTSVMVREREDGIEIWTAHSGSPRAPRALPPIPSDARRVPGVVGDSYEGDPSIGAVPSR